MNDATPQSDARRPTGRRSRLWFVVAVAALLIIAAGLRLYRVGMPDLWGDEILYLRMCHPGLSVAETVSEHLKSYSYIGHLPSTAVLTNLGMKALGMKGKHDITPFAARLPSVAMGVLTVALLAFWVFRMSGSVWAGLSCLALSAVSFIHVWYSREAYHYPGEILYAVGLCLTFWEATKARRSVVQSLLLLAIVTLVAVLVTFSHPTGALMPAVLAIYALALAAVYERRNWRLYVASAVLLGMALLPILIAGIGQTRDPASARPWSMIPAETWQLAQFMTFGPGLVRGLVGVGLLGFGIAVVWRTGGHRERLFLLLLPLMLIALHSYRLFGYHIRYFLLLWPVVTWLLARAAGTLCARMTETKRFLLFVLLVLALWASVFQGYDRLYQIHGKAGRLATLRDLIDAKLPEGTLCVWDEGHRLRFLPDYLPPHKPMLFAALPEAYTPADYERGTPQKSLRLLTDAFPSVAFMELGDDTACTTPALKAKGQVYRDQIREILPDETDIGDPAFDALVKSGWNPSVFIPPGTDRVQAYKKVIQWSSLHLYSRVDSTGNGLIPVFSPDQWRLVFLKNGTPIVVGNRTASVGFHGLHEASGIETRMRLTVVGFVPGTLSCSGGEVTSRVEIRQAGQVGAVEMNLRDDNPSQIRLSYQPMTAWREPREPFFGIVAVGRLGE